jgi:hypothetical protein
LTAVAAFTVAAVVVWAAVRRRERRLRREAVSERLMAGRMCHDNAALVEELARFQRRVDPLLVREAVTAAAGVVVDEVADDAGFEVPLEGGPR